MSESPPGMLDREPRREGDERAAVPDARFSALDLLLGTLAVLLSSWAVRVASAPAAAPVAKWSNDTAAEGGAVVALAADHSIRIGETSYDSLAAADGAAPLPPSIRLAVAPAAKAHAVMQLVQWLQSRGAHDIMLVSLPAFPQEEADDEADRKTSK